MTTQQQCFLKGCSRCEWRWDERVGGSTFFERPRDIFQFTFKRRSTQGGSYGEKGFLLLRIVKNLELCSYKLEGHLGEDGGRGAVKSTPCINNMREHVVQKLSLFIFTLIQLFALTKERSCRCHLSTIILMIRYNTAKGKKIFSGQNDHMIEERRWTEDHSHSLTSAHLDLLLLLS